MSLHRDFELEERLHASLTEGTLLLITKKTHDNQVHYLAVFRNWAYEGPSNKAIFMAYDLLKVRPPTRKSPNIEAKKKPKLPLSSINIANEGEAQVRKALENCAAPWYLDVLQAAGWTWHEIGFDPSGFEIDAPSLEERARQAPVIQRPKSPVSNSPSTNFEAYKRDLQRGELELYRGRFIAYHNLRPVKGKRGIIADSRSAVERYLAEKGIKDAQIVHVAKD